MSESASPMPKVGFVGTGLMGQGMAKNIVEKGYPLIVIAHRNRAPVDDLVSRGATEADSLESLAKLQRARIVEIVGTAAADSLVEFLARPENQVELEALRSVVLAAETGKGT